MWGRQLEYRRYKWSDADPETRVITPDRRQFETLRRAFACYRVGLGERGPDNDELEVMRRTLAWLNCSRYEYQVVASGAKCPARSQLARIDNRRVICDVFGGSPALYAGYLRYLEMLRMVTLLESGVHGLTREGQSALVMLELTRPRSGFWFDTEGLRGRKDSENWGVDRSQPLGCGAACGKRQRRHRRRLN